MPMHRKNHGPRGNIDRSLETPSFKARVERKRNRDKMAKASRKKNRGK